MGLLWLILFHTKKNMQCQCNGEANESPVSGAGCRCVVDRVEHTRRWKKQLWTLLVMVCLCLSPAKWRLPEGKDQGLKSKDYKAAWESGREDCILHYRASLVHSSEGIGRRKITPFVRSCCPFPLCCPLVWVGKDHLQWRVIPALRCTQKGLLMCDAKGMSKGGLTSPNSSRINCCRITAASETFLQSCSFPSFFLISSGPWVHMLLIFCLFKARSQNTFYSSAWILGKKKRSWRSALPLIYKINEPKHWVFKL